MTVSGGVVAGRKEANRYKRERIPESALAIEQYVRLLPPLTGVNMVLVYLFIALESFSD